MLYIGHPDGEGKMNKVGHYLWLAFVVVVVVYAVVANLDEVPGFLKQTLDSFLKLPLISQIIIGVVVWLISLIVGWYIYSYLFKEPEEGSQFWVLAFLILWPPAWPIAVIVLLVMWIMKRNGRGSHKLYSKSSTGNITRRNKRVLDTT